MTMDREPCPFRIVDDAGGAFGFGIDDASSVYNKKLLITLSSLSQQKRSVDHHHFHTMTAEMHDL